MKKRIVITGLGVVSPLGCNTANFFKNILDGKSNLSYPKGLKNQYDKLSLVSLVSDEFEAQCREKQLPGERDIRNYILLAASQALEEAKLKDSDALKEACMYVGSSKNYLFDNLGFSIDSSQADLIGKYPVDMLNNVTSRLGICGETALLPVACSGGNVAMALAANKIQAGETEIALAGGADIFNELCYSIFYSLGILSETSSSPFMKNRDGITIGEGAGFLVVESLESAQKRGAKILAELSGYDMSCDAYHLTTPNPEGDEAVKAMMAAIENSGLKISDIDCISPHATGTQANDLQEANAMYKVFGSRAKEIPVSATKSALGHCMGAASAMEAILSVLTLSTNMIPKTLNPNNDTCEYDLNISEFSKVKDINHVLSNSFAFGGNICCVILSKFK